VGAYWRSMDRTLLSRAVARLPQGRSLPPDEWAGRHRGMLAVLWLHLPFVAAFGLIRDTPPLHLLGELSIVALLAALAAPVTISRRVRSALVSAGLLSCSALLVHLSGGVTEMHFHFFVMVALIGMYEDWVPFLIAVGYVLVDHGVVGLLVPDLVFDTPAARANPLLWTTIHGVFILGMATVGVVKWRVNEGVRERAAEADRLRLDGERTALAERQESRRLRDELLGVIARELRGPLTSILGFSEVLMEEGDELPRGRRGDFVGRIAVQARRIERLMGGVFDSAEATRSTEPEHTHLSRTLRLLVAAVVEPAEQERVRIGRIEPGLCAAIPYPALRVIVGNLIDNVLGLTRPGGSLAIDAGRAEPGSGPDPREWVTLTCSLERDEAILTDPRRLFEPILLAGPVGPDGEQERGMALHLVAQFARAHQAQVTVGGSGQIVRFTVWMPGASHEVDRAALLGLAAPGASI
jgi:signal transduction histidine kinase